MYDRDTFVASWRATMNEGNELQRLLGFQLLMAELHMGNRARDALAPFGITPAKLAEAPLYIDDTAGTNLLDVHANARVEARLLEVARLGQVAQKAQIDLPIAVQHRVLVGDDRAVQLGGHDSASAVQACCNCF